MDNKQDRLLRGPSKTIGQFNKYSAHFCFSQTGPEFFDTLLWGKNPKRNSSSSSFKYKTGEKCAVFCRFCAQALQCSIFEARKCVACAKWIPAGMFMYRFALQVDALEHAKLKN